MSCRVGLVSHRAELVVEVAALVAEAGGVVVTPTPPVAAGDGSFDPSGGAWGTAHGVEVVLVDTLTDPADVPSWEGPSGSPDPVLMVICREPERSLAAMRARLVGAGHVVALPSGREWLRRWVQHPRDGAPLVGVLGAVGGAGATTVAIGLAAARSGLLVDLDPDGAGLHLPLGLDDVSGVRWEDLPISARGPLDAESFRGALPRAGGMLVVCGLVPETAAGPVASVLATTRAHEAGAVLDLGRRDRQVVLKPDDWLVLVVPTTVAGVAAAQRTLDRTQARVVLAVREWGWLPRDSVVAELGSPPAVRIPRLRRATELAECGQLMSGVTGRTLLRLGQRLSELTS